jgi:hypothetical protein
MVEDIRRVGFPLAHFRDVLGGDVVGQGQYAKYRSYQKNGQAEPDGPPIFLYQQRTAHLFACHDLFPSLSTSRRRLF